MGTPPGFKEHFLLAAHDGDFQLLQRLAASFENGEGPGKVSYTELRTSVGQGALHLAAIGGNTEICKFLIEKMNFNIDDTDNKGQTPLVQAIIQRHLSTTNFLIDNGADVNKSSNDGATPLHHAAAKGTPDIMKLLVSRGSDLSATSQMGMPLHYAAMHGNIDTLRLLLDLKADPNCISPMYMSPLLVAVSASSIECMELLLKSGADPNLEMSDSQSGKTALECAALSGCREMVELMYPVTSRIASYPDWSVNGVMQHIRSKEARKLQKTRMREGTQLVKARAQEAFKRKDYVDALYWYSQAALSGPPNAKLLSNKSLCHALLNEGAPALEDAQACVRLEPGWAKAHYRVGAALKVLKRYHEAAEAFSRALALDPLSKETEDAHREALAECVKRSH